MVSWTSVQYMAERNQNCRPPEFWIRELSMEHIRRIDRSAEQHSDDMNKREEAYAPNNDNGVSRPEWTSDKSNAMKLKVFIADDSTEIRNRLKEMLKENKSIYLIGESGDAEQAIMALRHLKPDVVILDIHMPGGGMRVLEDSKTRYPGTTVIIFTVFSYPQYRQAYLSAGADFFLDKTDDLQKMADVLAELAQTNDMNGNNKKRGKDG